MYSSTLHDRRAGLIIAPTRELADQINKAAKKFCAVYTLKTAAVYGGVGKWQQVKALRAGAELVIGTPDARSAEEASLCTEQRSKSRSLSSVHGQPLRPRGVVSHRIAVMEATLAAQQGRARTLSLFPSLSLSLSLSVSMLRRRGFVPKSGQQGRRHGSYGGRSLCAKEASLCTEQR